MGISLGTNQRGVLNKPVGTAFIRSNPQNRPAIGQRAHFLNFTPFEADRTVLENALVKNSVP